MPLGAPKSSDADGPADAVFALDLRGPPTTPTFPPARQTSRSGHPLAASWRWCWTTTTSATDFSTGLGPGQLWVESKGGTDEKEGHYGHYPNFVVGAQVVPGGRDSPRVVIALDRTCFDNLLGEVTSYLREREGP